MGRLSIRKKEEQISAEEVSDDFEASEEFDLDSIDFKELLEQNVSKERAVDKPEYSLWVHWLSMSSEFRWASVALPLFIAAYFVLPVPLKPWFMLLVSFVLTTYASCRLIYASFKVHLLWSSVLVFLPVAFIAYMFFVADPGSMLHRSLFKIGMGYLLTWPLFATVFVVMQFGRVWRSLLLGVVSFVLCYGVPIAFQNREGARMEHLRELQVEFESWDLKRFMDAFRRI